MATPPIRPVAAAGGHPHRGSLAPMLKRERPPERQPLQQPLELPLVLDTIAPSPAPLGMMLRRYEAAACPEACFDPPGLRLDTWA